MIKLSASAMVAVIGICYIWACDATWHITYVISGQIFDYDGSNFNIFGHSDSTTRNSYCEPCGRGSYLGPGP